MARQVSSLAALGPILVAAAVIVGAGVWLMLVTWLAGRNRKGEILAVAAGIGGLTALRTAVAVACDGVTDGEPRVYDQMARDLADAVTTLGADPVDRSIGNPPLPTGAYLVMGQTAIAVEALNLLLAILVGLLVSR